MTQDAPVLLSIGHGYSAAAVSRRLLDDGWRVIGTTRSETGAARLRAQGVEPYQWPGADLKALVAQASHVLSSVAPDGATDPVLDALGGSLAEQGLEWVGYFSTTGVYGDYGGDWVDETSATHPASRRGQARLKAEAGWHAMCGGAGVPLAVFRLAGIYGPGRGPFQSVLDGTARRIIKPGQVFNRIHVEDIALAVSAAIRWRAPGVFNICDDEPAPPQDVVSEAARLLGVEPSPEVAFDPTAMSPMAASFYSENKRVRNDLVKAALGIAWQFPSYREGLRALLEAERGDRRARSPIPIFAVKLPFRSNRPA